MTDLCGPCSRGDHPKCAGIRCWCTATKRCAANAALTAARAPKNEGSAVA